MLTKRHIVFIMTHCLVAKDSWWHAFFYFDVNSRLLFRILIVGRVLAYDTLLLINLKVDKNFLVNAGLIFM